MKKLLSAAGLLGISTALASCDTGFAQAEDITAQIETEESTIVEKLNAITSKEASVQSEFEKTLTEDEELSTLKDGSASIFENIETRQTDLDSLKESSENLKTHLDELTKIDNEELPDEELTAVEDNLKTVKSTLDQFIEQYSGSLEEQEKYFQSLTAEDATYQTLESGIEQINGSHAGTNDLLIQLDGQLVQLQTSRTEATAALEESQK